MNKGNFKFYVVCAVLILGFLSVLGYAEIFAEENATAQMGDQVVIDYTYTDLEGEEQEVTDSTYLIGSNDMTETFDTELFGSKKGDEKTIEVTYPDTYVDSSMANETFTYDVVVDKVLVCTGPEDVCLAQ